MDLTSLRHIITARIWPHQAENNQQKFCCSCLCSKRSNFVWSYQYFLNASTNKYPSWPYQAMPGFISICFFKQTTIWAWTIKEQFISSLRQLVSYLKKRLGYAAGNKTKRVVQSTRNSRETVSFVSPRPQCSPRLLGEHWGSPGNNTHCFPWRQSLSVLLYSQLKTRKKEKKIQEIVCLTPAGLQICRGFKEHDLITCESKVQVAVSLGVSEFCLPWELVVLTHDTWHVLLQSENVFEFGGISITQLVD